MTIQELIQSSGVTFGTSGVRGLETLLTDQLCGAYTEAFLSIFQHDTALNYIALGIDLRPSSPRIAAACAQSIRKLGLNVDFCGELPTPSLAYYAQEKSIPAIMVTGSHIPFDRNGIKFYRPDGEITKIDEQSIINSQIQITTSSLPYFVPENNPKAIELYIQRYANFFPEQILSGFKLGLYEHSSVARDVFREILERLGANVVSLGRTDVFVPIDTEAVSEEDIQRGKSWAKEQSFDAIISTDGDGDRPLISDELGNWIRGDIVGLMCASYLNISQLVVPVSCNTMIESCKKFNSTFRTRIGSPFVIEKMQSLNGKNGSIAGFEANGGFLLESDICRNDKLLKRLPTRDAVLPVLAILATSKELNIPISSLLNQLPKRFTASDRLQNFPSDTSANLIDSIIRDDSLIGQLLPDDVGEVFKVDLTDGLRITFTNNDVIHLRPSGNAPELRCYAETNTQSKANNLVRACLSKIAMRVS